MGTSNFLSINWKEAKALINSGELKAMGTNQFQINNQGEYLATPDKMKVYKIRHTASKVMFDLIATR